LSCCACPDAKNREFRRTIAVHSIGINDLINKTNNQDVFDGIIHCVLNTSLIAHDVIHVFTEEEINDCMLKKMRCI